MCADILSTPKQGQYSILLAKRKSKNATRPLFFPLRALTEIHVSRSYDGVRSVGGTRGRSGRAVAGRNVKSALRRALFDDALCSCGFPRVVPREKYKRGKISRIFGRRKRRPCAKKRETCKNGNSGKITISLVTSIFGRHPGVDKLSNPRNIKFFIFPVDKL